MTRRLNAFGLARRCPKCRGRVSLLYERMDGWEAWEIVEDRFAEPLGADGDHGGSVEAKCGGCGHRWVLRGVRVIDQLFDDDQDPDDGKETMRRVYKQAQARVRHLVDAERESERIPDGFMEQRFKETP